MTPFVIHCVAHNRARCACLGGRYDDDPVWDALFAQSQDMLKAMADEALAEYRAGRTAPIEALWAEEDPRVFLPNKAEKESAPEEETQEPSGWRERPGLL